MNVEIEEEMEAVCHDVSTKPARKVDIICVNTEVLLTLYVADCAIESTVRLVHEVMKIPHNLF